MLSLKNWKFRFRRGAVFLDVSVPRTFRYSQLRIAQKRAICTFSLSALSAFEFDGEVQNSSMISVGMHFSCFSPGSVDWNDLSRRLIGAESLFVARSMRGSGRPVAMKPCATDPIAVAQVVLVR